MDESTKEMKTISFNGTKYEVVDDKARTGLESKQDTLTFDDTPTDSSDKPVKSSGIKSALDAKQDKLTYDDTPKEGSSNPVKSSGVHDALQRKSNPNLLDNWYFPNPINQRGVSGTINTAGYFIDRWKLGNIGSTVEIVAGQGLKLTGSMQQVLEFAPGVDCIASVLTSDGQLWTSTDNTENVKWDATSKTVTITTTTATTLVAAKLEVGAEQTLAHKVGGVDN